MFTFGFLFIQAYSLTGDVLYATETPTACTSTTTSTDLGSATEGVTIVAWHIICKYQGRQHPCVIMASSVFINCIVVVIVVKKYM